MRPIIVFTLLAAATTFASEFPSPLQPFPVAIARPFAQVGPVHDERAAEPVPLDLAAVRRATAAFHDPAVAAAAGYLFNEPCHESAAGAMGIHAPNPALVRDGVIDPEQPEILLYTPREDGTLRLVGVEYMQLVRVRNPETLAVTPWLSGSPWPSNYDVVTPTPELFGQIFQGPMPGHTRTMPWHWDLHVWLWARNPNGTFEAWNPALSCGG